MLMRSRLISGRPVSHSRQLRSDGAAPQTHCRDPSSQGDTTPRPISWRGGRGFPTLLGSLELLSHAAAAAAKSATAGEPQTPSATIDCTQLQPAILCVLPVLAFFVSFKSNFMRPTLVPRAQNVHPILHVTLLMPESYLDEAWSTSRLNRPVRYLLQIIRAQYVAESDLFGCRIDLAGCCDTKPGVIFSAQRPWSSNTSPFGDGSARPHAPYASATLHGSPFRRSFIRPRILRR
jgi:hypothetical protein